MSFLNTHTGFRGLAGADSGVSRVWRGRVRARERHSIGIGDAFWAESSLDRKSFGRACLLGWLNVGCTLF